MKKRHIPRYFLGTLLLFFSITLWPTVAVDTTYPNATTTAITLTFDLKPDEYIYRDFLVVASDEPTVELSAFLANKKPALHYDPTFKEDKAVYQGPVVLKLTAHNPESMQSANLHVTYYRNTDYGLRQEVIPITLQPKKLQQLAYAIEAQDTTITEKKPLKIHPPVTHKPTHHEPPPVTWSVWITHFRHAHSVFIWSLLFLLLGSTIGLIHTMRGLEYFAVLAVIILTIATTVTTTLMGFTLVGALCCGLCIAYSTTLLMNYCKKIPSQRATVTLHHFLSYIVCFFCLYGIAALVPYDMLLWSTCALAAVVGLWYLCKAPYYHTAWHRLGNNIVGIMLVAFSLVCAARAYKATYYNGTLNAPSSEYVTTK